MLDESSDFDTILSKINEEYFLLQEENRIRKEEDVKSSQKIKELQKIIVELSNTPTVNPAAEENEKLREFEMKNVILGVEKEQAIRKIEEHEAMLKANKDYILQLKMNHHDMEEQVKEKNKEIEIMKTKAEIHNAAISDVDKKMQALVSQFARVQNSFEVQKRFVAEAKENQKNLKDKIYECKESVSTARKQIDKAAEQIIELKKENKTLSDQLLQKTNECKLATNEVQAYKATISKFKEHQQKLQDERITFLRTIDQSQANMREQAVYTNRLEQTISEIHEEKNKISAEMHEVVRVNREREEELRMTLSRTESSVLEAKETNCIQQHKWDLLLADKDAAVEFARNELNKYRKLEREELEKNLALNLKITQKDVHISNLEGELQSQKHELELSKEKISQIEHEVEHQTQLYHKTLDSLQRLKSTNTISKSTPVLNTSKPVVRERDSTTRSINSDPVVLDSSSSQIERVSRSTTDSHSPNLQYSVTIEDNEDSGLLDLGLDDDSEVASTSSSKSTILQKSLPHSQTKYSSSQLEFLPKQSSSQISYPLFAPSPANQTTQNNKNIPPSPANQTIQNNNKNINRSSKPAAKPPRPPKGTLVILGDKNANNQKCMHCKGSAYGYMIPCTHCSKLFHQHCIPPDSKNQESFVCGKCDKDNASHITKKRKTKN